jgi:hypothetical protein
VPVDARRVLLDDGTAAKVGGACAPPDDDDDEGGGVADASAADQSFPALFGHSCVRKCASAAVWRACIAERPFLSRFTHGYATLNTAQQFNAPVCWSFAGAVRCWLS